MSEQYSDIPEYDSPQEGIEFDIETNMAKITAIVPRKLAEVLLLESKFREINPHQLFSAAIQYANITDQVDCYRIKNPAGEVVDTITPDMLMEPLLAQLNDDGSWDEMVILPGITVPNKFGIAVGQLSKKHDMSVSELMTVGLLTQQTLRPHYINKDKVFGVIKDTETMLAPVTEGLV